MFKVSILLVICTLFVSQSDAWLGNRNWVHWLTRSVWRSGVNELGLNRSECVFFRNEGYLGCAGVDRSVVECPGVLNMTGLDQDMFGSFVVGVDSLESVNSVTRFHLYPNLVDYPHHMVSKLGLRGVPVEFCLHDSVDLPVFGVRVTNSTCFANLLTALRGWNTNEVFTVSSFEVVKPTAVRLSELFVV